MDRPRSHAGTPPSRALKLTRPSPALVISVIALFFAVSGFGLAAKNQITGKNVKNGSITSKDLAKGAVKAKNLAKGAVKSSSLAPGAVTPGAIAPGAVGSDALAPSAVGPDAIAPNAVRTPHLWFKICPNGVIESSGTSCPITGDRYGRATDVEMTTTVPLPSITCYLRESVQFSEIYDSPTFLEPWTGDQFLVKDSASYEVTVNGTWATGDGVSRFLEARRIIGSGPNQGEHYALERVIGPPTSGDGTSQSLTFTTRLERDDRLELQVGACGDDVTLTKVSMSMVKIWEADAS